MVESRVSASSCVRKVTLWKLENLWSFHKGTQIHFLLLFTLSQKVEQEQGVTGYATTQTPGQPTSIYRFCAF